MKMKKRKEVVEPTQEESGQEAPAGEEANPQEVDKDGDAIMKPVEETKEATKEVGPKPMEVDKEVGGNFIAATEEVDWEKCEDKAIQYSMKRSEIATRRGGRGRPRKFEALTLDCVKEKIVEMEEEYTEAAKPLNKVWAPTSFMDETREMILAAVTEEEIAQILLNRIEEGFINPMNMKSVDSYKDSNHMEVESEKESSKSNKDMSLANKVIENDIVFYRNNRKIKKFWSSESLRETWKEFTLDIKPGDICPLFFSVYVFLGQTDVYVEKLQTKLEMKNKKQSHDSKSGTGHSSKNDRKRKAGFYKEASSDDSDSGEGTTRRKSKRQKIAESSFSEDSVEDNESEGDDEDLVEEEDNEEENSDENWDENCYKCGKEGECVCCETCPKVAHLKCAGLKKIPKDEWY